MRVEFVDTESKTTLRLTSRVPTWRLKTSFNNKVLRTKLKKKNETFHIGNTNKQGSLGDSKFYALRKCNFRDS